MPAHHTCPLLPPVGAAPSGAVIDPKQIQDWIGLSRPTAYRLMKRGQFPQLVQLSPGRRGWLRSEVQQWLAERAAARHGGKR